MEHLEFGICKNCGHEVVKLNSRWMHHVTRSKLTGLPHWPAGHVITLDCKQDHCECNNPEPNQNQPLKTKLVYLGKSFLTSRL